MPAIQAMTAMMWKASSHWYMGGCVPAFGASEATPIVIAGLDPAIHHEE
jgi:hypothetical protein